MFPNNPKNWPNKKKIVVTSVSSIGKLDSIRDSYAKGNHPKNPAPLN